MQKNNEISLVVMIPAFNEADTVGQVIEKIPKRISSAANIDIIVIDDGSEDETAAVAAGAGAKVVSFARHRGLGAAFGEGLRKALSLGADVIVNIDGDGQFNPEDIEKLIEPIVQGKADMATASRFKEPNLTPKMPWIKKWGNRRVAKLVNKLANQNLSDVSCGFRAYSRDAALRATLIGSHTYTHEIILDLAFRGLRIVEVPVKVAGVRQFGKSKVADNLWQYGFNSLIIMLRAFRDYRPMRVFGGISLVFLALAFICGIFVITHFIITGAFSPYIFVAFLGGGFAFVCLICYITALLAGMVNRLRILQDEQLFILRKQQYARKIERQEG